MHIAAAIIIRASSSLLTLLGTGVAPGAACFFSLSVGLPSAMSARPCRGDGAETAAMLPGVIPPSFMSDAGEPVGSGVMPERLEMGPLPGVCMYELHGEKAGMPDDTPDASSARRRNEDPGASPCTSSSNRRAGVIGPPCMYMPGVELMPAMAPEDGEGPLQLAAEWPPGRTPSAPGIGEKNGQIHLHVLHVVARTVHHERRILQRVEPRERVTDAAQGRLGKVNMQGDPSPEHGRGR